MTQQVHCPHCQRAVDWTSENNYRPFCSARCQLIDWGAWARAEHVIPGEHTPDSWLPADKTDQLSDDFDDRHAL